MVIIESDRFAFINNVDEVPTSLVTRIQIKGLVHEASLSAADLAELKGRWHFSIINDVVSYYGDHTLRGDIYLSGSNLVINYLPDTNLRDDEIGFTIHVCGTYTGIDMSILDKMLPINRRSTHFLESVGVTPISQIRIPGTTISNVAPIDVLGIRADYLAVYDMVPYLAVNPKSAKGYSLMIDPRKLDYFVDGEGNPVSYDPTIEGIKRSGDLDLADYEATILESLRQNWDITEEPAIDGCIRYRSISAFAEQEILSALRNFRSIDESSFVLFKNYEVPVSNAFKREASLRGVRSNDFFNDYVDDETTPFKSVLVSYEVLAKVFLNSHDSDTTLTTMFNGYDVLVETGQGLDQLLNDFNSIYNSAKVDGVKAIATSYLTRLENMCRPDGEFFNLNRRLDSATIQEHIGSWVDMEDVISFLMNKHGFVSLNGSKTDAFCARMKSLYPRMNLSYNGSDFVATLDGALVDTAPMYYILSDYLAMASLNSLDMPIKLATEDPDYLELKGLNINSGTKNAALVLCKNLILKYALDAMPYGDVDVADASQVFVVSQAEGGLADVVNQKYADVMDQISARLAKIKIVEETGTLKPTDLNEGGEALNSKVRYTYKPLFKEYIVERSIFEHPVPKPFICQSINLDMISKTQARLWIDFNFLPFLSICPAVTKAGKSVDDYRDILKAKGLEMLKDVFTDSDVRFMYVEGGYSTQLGRMRIALGNKTGFMRTKSYSNSYTYSQRELYAGRVPIEPSTGWFGIKIGEKTKAEDPYVFRVSKIFDVVSAEFTKQEQGNVVNLADKLDSQIESIATQAAIQAVLQKLGSYGLHKDDRLAGEIDQALVLLDDLLNFSSISTKYLQSVDSLLEILGGTEGTDPDLITTLRGEIARAQENNGRPIYYLSYSDASVITNGRSDPQTLGHYLFGRQ